MKRPDSAIRLRAPYGIRRAVAADVQAISAVHVAAFAEAYAGIIPDAVIDSYDIVYRAASWQRIIGAGTIVWVMTEDDLPIGFASIRGEEIGALYLHPGWWRLGLGRALLVRLLANLRRGGAPGAYLWALEANHRARDFYLALGGTAGERRPVVVGPVSLPEVRYDWSFVGD